MLRDKVVHISDAIQLVFQGLHPECVAETVHRITSDPILKDKVEIHLARKVFANLGLAEELLTDKAVGSFRNDEAEPEIKLILTGPPDDSEWNTVQWLQVIGEQEIMEADTAWIEEFAPAVMNDRVKLRWKAALRGLTSLAFAKLPEFAAFVVNTADSCAKGKLLPEALGLNLPALRLPCRAQLFTIPEKQMEQPSQWKRRFGDHKKSAQCYLFKKDKSDTLLDNDVLAQALAEYRAEADHDPSVAAVFEEYVAADYGWTSASEKMATLDWGILNEAFFERVKAAKRQNLADQTRTLFATDARMPDLTGRELEYLDELATTGTKGDPSPEDKSFFRKHYRELQNADPSLFSRWESFILEKSVESDDFFVGVAQCLRLLRPRAASKRWKICVRAKASKEKDLFQVNEATGTYFATRYRGLPAVLGNFIHFRDFEILKFPELLEKWRADSQVKKRLRVSSTSRKACQLVFYVELEDDPQRQIKLVWHFNPKSLAANLRHDMERLSKASHPAVFTEVSRETAGRNPLPLELADSLCLQPAFGRASGTLVPPMERLNEYAVVNQLTIKLDALVASRALSSDQKASILTLFTEFEAAHQNAITAFLDGGLGAHKQVADAATAYGTLLAVCSSGNFSDIVLGTILPIVLSISTVNVRSFGANAQHAIIVPPWHPLRLLAVTSKARQFASAAEALTAPGAAMSDADGELFFEDVSEWLGHIYYPEVVCHLRGSQPDVLSICDQNLEYSVHEPPVRRQHDALPTDDDPKEAAAQIAKIIGSYLELQPHERDNLSVILFNCDSELLPGEVVRQIRRLSEDEEQDAMCQVLLAHSDKSRLRNLYRALARSAESSDIFNTSEATREFMARLRINIMVTESQGEAGNAEHPYDIVFSEDTIARHSTLQWETIDVNCQPPEVVKPSAWSRRRPMRSGAISSTVYLTAPAGPESAWQYRNALAHAIHPDEARKVSEGKCLVPCRSLAIHEEKVGQLIEQMHSLGNWVVNYDELLHRKLLENRGIRIIRYKQLKTQGRNLIISSNAKDALLRNALRQLLYDLLPHLDEPQVTSLINGLISEATAISGNLVLRAVRRAENAKELLGLVLSKFLISREIGLDRHYGWFLLDDYAAWLGEEEEQIADILCLAPGNDDGGKPVLDVVVTEAKFAEHGSVQKRARESASQLRQTLARLEIGLGSDASSIDRNIWLARISDMIVDGIEAAAIDPFDAIAWRQMVREGKCAVRIRGYSHIFDRGGPDGSPSAHEASKKIKDTENGWQEVFSPSDVKANLLAFLHGGQTKRHVDMDKKLQSVLPTPQNLPSSDIIENSESPGSKTEATVGPQAPQTGAAVTVLSPKGETSLLSFLPPVQSPTEYDEHLRTWVETTTIACRKALLSYDMPAELVAEPILTPNSLLLKFRGTDELTAAAVEKKRTELLTTHALEVVSIRPELGAVVLAIRRSQRQIITIGEVWRRWNPSTRPTGNTELVIGVQEHDNKLLHLAPYPRPHTLVAGGTGSGKSVLLQNLLLGIVATNTPKQAQIAIIDPKSSAQLAPFRRLDHMFQPIITDPEPALETLSVLVLEMDQRNKRLAEADAADIDEYIEVGHYDMPRIWLIYDEFGDWIRDDEFKSHAMPILDRLAMKARSSGIYLVLAAQRPDNSIFSMVLRSNLGNRLALQVADAGTSDVATGIKELRADRLLGEGHLLAILGHLPDPVYAQVPFVSTADVRQIVARICALYAPEAGPALE
jgi:S-DNA-T family DNA segregation ATPase FtsK/SpoIIIE